MHHSSRLAIALAAMSVVAGAAAAPITFRVNVGTIGYDNSAGLLPFGATAASTFQVNYTFESTTTNTPTFPGVGSYFGTLSSYEVVMNGVTFTGQPNVSNSIQVFNDYGNPGFGDYMDGYHVNAQDLVTGPGQDAYMLNIRLENAYNADPVTTAITSTDLPLAPFDVSGFITDNTVTFALFTNINGQARTFSLSGGVTSLEFVTATPPPPPAPPPPPLGGPNPVPAPGTLALFLAGLGALAAQRRRQSRARVDAA